MEPLHAQNNPNESHQDIEKNHDPYTRCNHKDTASLIEECHFNFIKLIIDHEFPETLHNHFHIYIYKHVSKHVEQL